MDRMTQLEGSGDERHEKPLSKKEERLLEVARQRSKKGGAVERRHPLVFEALVARGLLTKDGKYIE